MQSPTSRWMLKPVRLVWTHIRLVVSVIVGVGIYWILPPDLPWLRNTSTRFLIGWNIGLVLYLVSTAFVLARFDLGRVRRRAKDEDEGDVLILVLTVAAAAASVVAIIAELGSVKSAAASSEKFTVAHAIFTITLSWIFVHVIFTLHYAHEYYGSGARGGGLDFPNDKQPDYWDFLYLAFCIGTTFQVSDVEITSKAIRRTVAAHGAVSFVYNVAILALVVNIGSQFIGGGK